MSALVMHRRRDNRSNAHLSAPGGGTWCSRPIPDNWKVCVAYPDDPAVCQRCVGALLRASKADLKAGRALTPHGKQLLDYEREREGADS